MSEKFETALEALINKHCEENESNTPDFILAKYIQLSLNAFNEATCERDEWYGIDPQPGNPFARSKRGE